MTHPDRTILVAVGRADDRDQVLEWAAREARSRHTGVHLVRGYQFANATVPWWQNPKDRVIRTEIRARATRVLDSAVTQFRHQWPDVEVSGAIHYGVVSDLLTSLADAHALTVLGTRHLGAVGAAALGSVSTVVAARAHRPVVVVNGPPGKPSGSSEDRTDGTSVVVGVTGGRIDEDLLGFAFDHADRHGTALDAVYCWPPELLSALPWRVEEPPPEQADRWLAESLAGWREKFPAVPVHPHILRAHPVEELATRSVGQELLVIGARAQHPRLQAPLGSVSQALLHHATCPVAVVH